MQPFYTFIKIHAENKMQVFAEKGAMYLVPTEAALIIPLTK